jgi:hypothetical protein
MKGVKFTGQKDPDGSHDEKGQQEGENVLLRSRTGRGRFPLGVMRFFNIFICLLINNQQIEPFLHGSPESPTIPLYARGGLKANNQAWKNRKASQKIT